eukprot:snap_masked-scaffold_3-processed-gene-21.18-mRNA-1 protein AED:1.00 eAED:1.00 QI:0/0/0/0/1/1/3/0/73
MRLLTRVKIEPGCLLGRTHKLFIEKTLFSAVNLLMQSAWPRPEAFSAFLAGVNCVLKEKYLFKTRFHFLNQKF